MYPVREAGGTRGVKRYMKSVNSRVFRVAITYIVLAVLWVLVTDYFLQSSVTDVRALTWFQNYKGVAFVLFSGGLVYLLLSREVNQRERKWKEYLRDREQLLREVQRNHDELERAYEETIEGWARAIEMRNREVKDHSLRVTELVLRLGQAMGLDEETLSHMRRGSLLHDIGKMNVPDAILMKEGPLSPSERELIEKHPDWAYEMLAPVTYLQEALEIPRFHHERWNGTGYPNRLKGEEIPLPARIFSVVDVWDALTSDRSYRGAMDPQEAMDYIRSQAGIAFDPQVVEAFVRLDPARLNGASGGREGQKEGQGEE